MHSPCDNAQDVCFNPPVQTALRQQYGACSLCVWNEEIWSTVLIQIPDLQYFACSVIFPQPEIINKEIGTDFKEKLWISAILLLSVLNLNLQMQPFVIFYNTEVANTSFIYFWNVNAALCLVFIAKYLFMLLSATTWKRSREEDLYASRKGSPWSHYVRLTWFLCSLTIVKMLKYGNS